MSNDMTDDRGEMSVITPESIAVLTEQKAMTEEPKQARPAEPVVENPLERLVNYLTGGEPEPPEIARVARERFRDMYEKFPAEPVVEKCGHEFGAMTNVCLRCGYADPNSAASKPAEPPAVWERAEKYLDGYTKSRESIPRNVASVLMADFAAEELSAFVREVEARRDSHGVSEDFEASMRAVLKERTEGRR